MYDQRLVPIGEILPNINFKMESPDLPGEVEDRDTIPEHLAESETHNLRARQEIGPS